jgi:hypothetical protein
MDEKVNKPTYYELNKEKCKKYQQTYRETHLEDVRNKDRERKRKKYKSADKGARPVTRLVWKENVIVKFD